MHTVEAILTPHAWGLFNFGPSKGGLDREGLIREGAYSQNQVTRTYLIAFRFFFPIFC